MRFPRRQKGVTLGPGETLAASGTLPADVDPTRVGLQVKWECGGCGRKLYKIVPLMDANRNKIDISCPSCSPDLISSRDVSEQP